MNHETTHLIERVWRQFAPQPDETITASTDSDVITVSTGSSSEGFSDDLDGADVDVVVRLADRIQTILTEYRQQLLPDCPFHPRAHPLTAEAVGSRAVWVCPVTGAVARPIVAL